MNASTQTNPQISLTTVASVRFVKCDTRSAVGSAASRRSWLLSVLLAAAVSALPLTSRAYAESDSVRTVADVVAEHAIAQQGLAIALASNVLQSHLLYVSAALGDTSGEYPGTCSPLDDADPNSGGMKAAAPTPPPGTIPPVVHVTLFYDGACTKKYMVADVSVQEPVPETYSVSNLVTQYYATDGTTPLVQLTSTASATLTDTTLSLHGLGTLVGPAGRAINASLGLVCGNGAASNSLLCAGGVVQNFATLNTAVGSVNPLTLIVNENDNSLTFSSTTPGAFRSGAVGSLALQYTDATASALTINGGAVYGSNQVVGQAAAFSLFPPMPTGWTSNDTSHDLHFQITVVSATTRNLSLSITRISNGSTRASGNLDQSGTGSIIFSDGSIAEVRGWVIADSVASRIFANGFDTN